MIEKAYLGLILIFFILAFAVRNIKTYLSTKKSIRGKSLKLTISVIISTIIYCLIILRLTILKPKFIFEIDLPKFINTIGLLIVFLGFVIGILALIAMKDSWRVGIKYDQKTDLITTGIYSISRNPYFLSYNILIFGYILIFTSPILIVLYIILVVVFHRMILEEEKYLQSIQGAQYEEYKSKVNRYFTIKQ
ncbi:MAG: isoprenylcysteine carboxylmethyltransferase family protein [Ignavibacteriae bacterium]|nr:isoprenylcysteine carboxylmethyltransferase family protein [Ignavibacteriota bacterium]NOG98933.1 isoprenylcysteine carboxylmethyltransferase family protein [Ignavibacteriota bacterium]